MAVGVVAQRLEQGTHNPLVGGSNPPDPIKRASSEFSFEAFLLNSIVIVLGRFQAALDRTLLV